MAGLRAFRAIPQSLREWSRWMRDQKVINSEPTSGLHRITNLYYDKTNDELVVIFEDDPQP